MGSNRLYVRSLILLLVLISCGEANSPRKNSAEKPLNETGRNSSEPSGRAAIIRENGDSLATPSSLTCNGYIKPDASYSARISPHMEGYLKKIYVQPGEYVKKGQLVAAIEHPDFVYLQLEYLETKSDYEYARTNFKRQGELGLEHATSLKVMQQAEKEFRKLEARLLGLEAHLEFLGVNPDSLNADNFQKSQYLYAPMSGYIIQVEGLTGELLSENTPLIYLADNRNAKLHIYCKKLESHWISKGDKVSFYLWDQPEKSFSATIQAIEPGKESDQTIVVSAKIDTISTAIRPGKSVTAIINLQRK